MKKNLVKLLAIAAMITSLGACGEKKGSSEESKSDPTSTSVSEVSESEVSEESSSESEPEEAVVITPSELYALDVDLETLETTAVYDNVLVLIEDLHLMAYAGQTAWFYYDLDAIGEDDSYYPFQMFGVEAEMIDESYNPEVDYADYWFDVQGRVKYEDGRIHLVDAIYANREADDNMEGFYSGIPSQWFDRQHWDVAATSDMHGTLTSGTIQLCTVPELKFEEDETFYAVFPGEDYDISNEDNYSPFPVVVPKDLSAASQAKLKEVFTGLEAGDGVFLFAVVINTEFGLGLSFMDGWASTKTQVGEISLITTWEEVAAEVAGDYYYVPNLEVDNYAISYSVDGSYIYEDVAGLYEDEAAWTGIAADQLANFGLSIFNVSLKTGKGADAQTLLQDRLEDAGWVVIDSEDNFYSYNVKNSNNEVFGAMNLEFSDSSIYVEYIGPYATLKYAEIATDIATTIAGKEGVNDVLNLSFLDQYGVAVVYVEELTDYVDGITNISSAFNYLYLNCIPEGFDPLGDPEYDEASDEYYVAFGNADEYTLIELYFGYNYVEVPVEEEPVEEPEGKICEGEVEPETQLVACGVWCEFDVSYYNPEPLTPYDYCYGLVELFYEAVGLSGSKTPDDSNWESQGVIHGQAAYAIAQFESVKTFPAVILEQVLGFEIEVLTDWTLADDGVTLICVIAIPEIGVLTQWQLWNYKDTNAVLDVYAMPIPQ